ncbi:tail fiber protein [Erwinia phage Cronus]|uniref:Tail fiber protein n=1 Tax=Erwinia phage Cronus TaxID=2163633 RepID=A0A2S1GLW1_9CAUD|nr:tail fiber protein [Erwinia phage Cronus]AWD90375.1 tail fiber protein [Erwinia phage Cronus]
MTLKLTETQKVSIRELLKTKLSHGTTTIVFEKADGTVRVLKGTRDKDIISEVIGESEYENYVNPKKARKEAVDMVPVFDTELESWRGFSIDKLISVNGVKVEHLVQLAS